MTEAPGGERDPRLLRYLPAVALARRYRPGWLRHDVVAGVVLAALLVPQGMAYAQLAGLPAVTGLYATLVPLVAYALVGPSRILVVGPDSAVSPLIAASVIPLAGADASARLALAGTLAILVGVVMALAGLLRAGLVTDLLSMPVRVGYLAGIAFTVIVSQAARLLGYTTGSRDLPVEVVRTVERIGDVEPVAALVGIACLATILVLRRVAPQVPGVAIAVVGATVATAALGLSEHGLDILGDVPGGLPAPRLPSHHLADAERLVLAAVGIAFVAFADTSVLSRSYASRLHDDVDQSQELVALGAANAAAGLFGGFPISTSSSRTAVAETLGARSQVAGLVGALALAIVLVAGTGLLHDLPSPALSAIVIAAVLGFIDLKGLRRLAQWRGSELAITLVAFAGVAFLGVLWGVGIAIGLSLAGVVARSWRPHDAVLGRAPGVKGYHDVRRYEDAAQVPGLVLYRFDAPLYFANAERFREQVHRLAADPAVRRVVIAAEPITDVDATAGEMLIDLVEELARRDVELAFAELKDHVREHVERYGLAALLGDGRFHPTVGVAVSAYVRDTGAEWVDWEDRAADGRR